MLTYKILPTRKANSVTVQCKFHIKLQDLEDSLKLVEPKIRLSDCYGNGMKELLLMNFEIVDLLKSADEILEFEIMAIGKEIHGKKMIY